MKLAKLLGMVSILLASVLASANNNLTYVEQAMVSGTLGGVPFTDQHMVIWLSGFDPDNVVVIENGWYAAYASLDPMLQRMTFTIGASPYYYFTDPTRFDVNQAGLWGGVHDSNPEGGIMVTFSDAFASYDLKTPFLASGRSQVNMELSFGTTGGDLIVTSMGDSVFNATLDSPVPEPSSLMLFGSGLLGLGAVVRRHICL